MKRSGDRMRLGFTTDKWKRTPGDYLQSSKDLLSSMQRIGFDRSCPVPLDVNGELLNGSHRVGCAIALGMKEIPVLLTDSKVWSPAWDRKWFLDNGFPEEVVSELEDEIGL
jgi:hypothetical protein